MERIEGKLLDLGSRSKSLDYTKSKYMLIGDDLLDSISRHDENMDPELHESMMFEIKELINLKDELIMDLIEFTNHVAILNVELEKNVSDNHLDNKNYYVLPLQNRTQLINKLNSEYILSAKRYLYYKCYLDNPKEIPLHDEAIKTINSNYEQSKKSLVKELKCYIRFIESIDADLAEFNKDNETSKHIKPNKGGRYDGKNNA